MNLRKAAYFGLVRLRGQTLGASYEGFLRETRTGIPPDTTKRSLVRLLSHCRQHVPYYAAVMSRLAGSWTEDPEEYLRQFPILTKNVIRARFDDLKSTDLNRRKWFINSSGGSTGEPILIIQDWEYTSKAGAVTLIYSKLAGREVGESELHLWGSTRDIIKGSDGWRAQFVNRLTNTTVLDAFRMTPARMREFIEILNRRRPKLILAYAEAIYELARFSEREGIGVLPQSAVMTSAGALYPMMRETIERVFKCRVFDRYGCREMGDIASERPDCSGLWVAPWSTYVEVVDESGNRVRDGIEGEILVTSLINFAMPLVRYRIGDRGVLAPPGSGGQAVNGQRLERVVGRTSDMFRLKNGSEIHGLYFFALLAFKDWVRKIQVVQKSQTNIVFRIVRSGPDSHQRDLDEVAAKTRHAVGGDCEVGFEFVDDIPPGKSGKVRFLVSEVHPEPSGRS